MSQSLETEALITHIHQLQTRVQELKTDLSSRSPDDRGMGAGDRHRARDDMEVDVDGEDKNEEEYAANREAVLPNAREFDTMIRGGPFEPKTTPTCTL